MIQEIKIKGLKFLDFHILYHASESSKITKATLYSELKSPDALKDFSILQEFSYKIQKTYITQEKEEQAKIKPKKRYELKIKTHAALVLIEALYHFKDRDQPYTKSRIYWIQEQITKQIL